MLDRLFWSAWCNAGNAWFVELASIKLTRFLKIHLRILALRIHWTPSVITCVAFQSLFSKQLRLPGGEDCATCTIHRVIPYTGSRGIKYWNYGDDRARLSAISSPGKRIEWPNRIPNLVKGTLYHPFALLLTRYLALNYPARKFARYTPRENPNLDVSIEEYAHELENRNLS